MWFGDYILSEFGHMSLFLKKIGVGLYSPTPKIIEPFFIVEVKKGREVPGTISESV